MRQWTFLLGTGLIPRINALFLGFKNELPRASSRPSAWSVYR